MANKPKTDRSADLLRLIKGSGGGDGLKVVRVTSAEPNADRFKFEGTDRAIGSHAFEIPVAAYPIRVGDRFLAYPIVTDGEASRWGLISKINGGPVLGTMTGPTSVQVDGVGVEYSGSGLLVPAYFAVDDATDVDTTYLLPGDIRPLEAGDRVIVTPILDGQVIKYAVLNKV